MYIKRLHIKNLGPISELTIEPRFLESGQPIPIVLVGQNGAGKSLTLSVLLDGMTEARRQAFTSLPEVEGNSYIRLSQKRYIKQGENFTLSEAVIASQTAAANFTEIVTTIPFSDFAQEHPELTAPHSGDESFRHGGFLKAAHLTGEAKSEIASVNFLYFPYFRYEKASWMHDKANLDFVRDNNYFGHARINPVRTSIIDETRRWILNLLLDRELYEKRINLVELPLRGIDHTIPFNLFQGYVGPNENLLTMINQVLGTMLKAKDPSIMSARIGIGPKQNREISVFITRSGMPEELVAHDISMLSSGELMTLAIATEIIRGHEIAKSVVTASLSDITGIVLIDEIDLHLHISFQKEVLPNIVRQFPSVQFVVTTHSPLFVLGLEESGDVDVFNLPIGNRIDAEDFSEFQAGYDIFVQKNDQFRSRFKDLSAKIAQTTKPLIVTEGKTDWQHLKYALEHLKQGGLYSDLDIEFFEFDDATDMGDSKLKQMCEAMAKIPQHRRIIFVFDRDVPLIVREMSGDPNSFRSLGNGVYSLCLPVPAHRQNYLNVSIEMLYTDSDLKTVDPVSGKRLWFTNEINIITEPGSDEKTFVAQDTPNLRNELKKKVFDQPADKIVDSAGTPVGLSKAAFAASIVGNPALSAGFDRTAFYAVFDTIREIVTGPA